jgi:hypothetical protein
MAPDWNKMMTEYADHETKLIAEVDCTAEGKPLCDANGAKGFPTLLWGDPADLQKYEGGRDYKAFRDFAEKKLVAMCSPAKIDLCDDAKKADIQKFMALPVAELDTLIAAKDEEETVANRVFDEAVKNLQKTYEGLQKTKEEKIEVIKESDLGLMKAVKAHNAKAGKKDEL